tara:strand:+ start:5040 stop:7376 length:2337 start_codon:yes stop_codon:yes gene_type:complete
MNFFDLLKKEQTIIEKAPSSGTFKNLLFAELDKKSNKIGSSTVLRHKFMRNNSRDTSYNFQVDLVKETINNALKNKEDALLNQNYKTNKRKGKTFPSKKERVNLVDEIGSIQEKTLMEEELTIQYAKSENKDDAKLYFDLVKPFLTEQQKSTYESNLQFSPMSVVNSALKLINSMSVQNEILLKGSEAGVNLLKQDIDTEKKSLEIIEDIIKDLNKKRMTKKNKEELLGKDIEKVSSQEKISELSKTLEDSKNKLTELKNEKKQIDKIYKTLDAQDKQVEFIKAKWSDIPDNIISKDKKDKINEVEKRVKKIEQEIAKLPDNKVLEINQKLERKNQLVNFYLTQKYKIQKEYTYRGQNYNTKEEALRAASDVIYGYIPLGITDREYKDVPTMGGELSVKTTGNQSILIDGLQELDFNQKMKTVVINIIRNDIVPTNKQKLPQPERTKDKQTKIMLKILEKLDANQTVTSDLIRKAKKAKIFKNKYLIKLTDGGKTLIPIIRNYLYQPREVKGKIVQGEFDTTSLYDEFEDLVRQNTNLRELPSASKIKSTARAIRGDKYIKSVSSLVKDIIDNKYAVPDENIIMRHIENIDNKLLEVIEKWNTLIEPLVEVSNERMLTLTGIDNKVTETYQNQEEDRDEMLEAEELRGKMLERISKEIRRTYEIIEITLRAFRLSLPILEESIDQDISPTYTETINTFITRYQTILSTRTREFNDIEKDYETISNLIPNFEQISKIPEITNVDYRNPKAIEDLKVIPTLLEGDVEANIRERFKGGEEE